MNKIKIDKIVFGGQGMGELDGKKVFLWNVLPGEEVEFEATKKKKDFIEGIATKIIKPSKYRIEPKEDHFLSCSPWQIMDESKEDQFKKEMVLETYQRIGKFGEDLDLDIYSDQNFYEYRNKMEYSFWFKSDESVGLAFHDRGGKYRNIIEPCQLAHPNINKVAIQILEWLNKNKISNRNLKSLIVRSNLKGEVMVGLFLKDKLKFKNYPEFGPECIGFKIYYSFYKSPASVPTELIYSQGKDYLEEEVLGVKMRYGLFSFFQVNVPIFTEALKDISGFIKKGEKVVDYYSGVGAIGLSLANKCKAVELVESNKEAVGYAKENIKLNEFKNAKAEVCEAEAMTNLISKDKTIIFDPPRAGLHEKVVSKVLKELPKKIIYMSCNISTQARDLQKFLPEYKIVFSRLYNFFPRTPHIEGIIVLEKK